MSIVNSRDKNEIARFPKTGKEQIKMQNIISSGDIFLSLAGVNYIYMKDAGRIQKLPYTFEISYIKAAKNRGEYTIISKQGSFIYNADTQKSEYNYAFKDFVSLKDNRVIGIVFADEKQKKKNFNLQAS